MALTTAYLVATSKLEKFLEDTRSARAPDRFTLKFLENLGYRSTNDRLFIGLLKALGFLDDNGAPLQRYYDFLDESQWKRILADGIEDAYEDLFRLNREAYKMSKAQVVGKLKSLTEGKKSENVLDNMARTFLALSKLADFTAPSTAVVRTPEPAPADLPEDVSLEESLAEATSESLLPRRPIEGLTYRIEIVLPPARDKAVYDAIFRSMKEHLL